MMLKTVPSAPTKQLCHFQHRRLAEIDRTFIRARPRELLQAFLEILERDAAAHERTDGDGARRRQADGLLPVGPRVEAAAVHGELTSEHGIEVHEHGLGVDGYDADGAPDTHHLGHETHRRGIATHLERDVGAIAARPLFNRADHVPAAGSRIGTEDLEPEALQEIDAERVDLQPPARARRGGGRRAR